MSTFLDLIDLASQAVGGAVVAASDEFFAPKENLIKPGEAQYIADKYTDRGKWMDGWESRRRRTPGHDWVIIRLGVPGAVRGVVVDTRHFRGNHPESCSIDACALPTNASIDDVLDESVSWREILPKSSLKGHTSNKFEIIDGSGRDAGDSLELGTRLTHVRLNIHPDGGIARLRIHGEVIPDWGHIDFRGGRIDLAAVGNGGRVLACSDMFFGSSHNLIMPGLPRNINEGWETRRRRGPGHDWVIVKLGAHGTLDQAVVDTTRYIGNAPGSCSIEACMVGSDRADDAGYLTSDYCSWQTVLPETRLQPNVRQVFDNELAAETAFFSHVRLNIYPDGGVARLRLFGTTKRSASIRAALVKINSRSDSEFEQDMKACCGAATWVQAMVEARPFGDVASMVRAADASWDKLDKFDWLEAFAAHPRIGEKTDGDDQSSSWSKTEQSGMARASDEVREQLVEANRQYYDHFGHNFIVYAAGKSAEQMLDLLRQRLDNEAGDELEIAADEQRKITRMRLGKLLRSMSSGNKK
ncbi:MAG: allantoicase [Myxococcota bacterium]